MNCPCGSKRPIEQCCAPVLAGEVKPSSAEALMRSRYVAYTQRDIEYLRRTIAPESRDGFDEAATRRWAKEARFKSLEILKTEKGGEADTEGTVEFLATFVQDGETFGHHEVSRFRKDETAGWLYVNGESHRHDGHGHHHHHEHHEAGYATRQPLVRSTPKVGRNDPCPCGSGQKFKKCCGRAA